jgi:hypothetical protein
MFRLVWLQILAKLEFARQPITPLATFRIFLFLYFSLIFQKYVSSQILQIYTTTVV